jgi:Ca-activated chloride channel homolog
MAEIYALLDQLEPLQRDTQHLRPVQALFVWPLAAALVAVALLLAPALRGRQ